MNLSIFVVATLALSTSKTAGPAAKPPPKRPPSATSRSAGPEIGPPLLPGNWTVRHPKWRSSFDLYETGTFVRAGGGRGTWTFSTEKGQLALRLNWDDWAPDTLYMVTPSHFAGDVRAGKMQMQRTGPVSRPEPPKPVITGRSDEFQDPVLRRLLSDSTWELKDGKHFTLHADGSTTGDWHDRKGYWRIVDKNTVEMKISWKPEPAQRLMVESEGRILRWSDEAFGGIAKRIESDAGVN